MEIIKEIIEIVLAILGVYIGGAIYNWGYRNGLKIQVEKIANLEEIVRRQSRRIHELLAQDYCSNPFPLIFNDKNKVYQSVEEKHLKGKSKAKALKKGKKGKK